MEGEFDAVLGVAFGQDSIDDVAALFRELDAASEAAGDIEVALFIESAAQAGGVVGLRAGGDGEVVSAFPFQAGRCEVDDVLEPLAFENLTAGRSGTLLIERGEGVGSELSFEFVQRLFVESLWT